MRIGSLSFRPYIYNTNTLSGSSLSRVSSIGDDLLKSKTDYSSLTNEGLNENPLRKGQTLNFVDVLGKQMQMGRMNASRIMRSGKEESVQVGAKDFPAANDKVTSNVQPGQNSAKMQHAIEAYQMNMYA